jgi:hypothetical protein
MRIKLHSPFLWLGLIWRGLLIQHVISWRVGLESLFYYYYSYCCNQPFVNPARSRPVTR